jgi:hypothetical protein
MAQLRGLIGGRGKIELPTCDFPRPGLKTARLSQVGGSDRVRDELGRALERGVVLALELQAGDARQGLGKCEL